MSEEAQPGKTDAKRRFAAFISYAHADAAVAAKLQAKLERYRLPKHIARAHAGGAAALGQIFRDREDLAAAPSLSDAIRAAISEAEALVVICSPDARGSRWVGEEIALFRTLHPDRPVLAAIIRGEPAEAFPEALTEGGTEPLAADLRAEADGEALGFLKIVAGIAGVPLDALVQRDAQRRIRRVTWITAGAIAAMLIMGIMTTLAIQARNEAARQRAEAEGLVEYMLTDLRDKLEGVGKIEIMEGVNRHAMRYYTRQGDLTGLSADSLSQRARIIEAMGRDDENRGHFEAAKRKYQELERIAAALLSNDPENPARVFDHAQSQNRLALLAFSRKKLPEALTGFEKADATLRSLTKPPSTKTDWMRLAAYINGNLCAVNLQLKRSLSSALERCEAAVKYNESLIERHPGETDLLYDLVFHLTWLGEALTAIGNREAALEATQKALGLIDRMKNLEPENQLWRAQEMEIHTRLTDKFKASGERQKQLKHLSLAREINASLIATEPQNALWQQYAERLGQN
jgi:tetratricopeptide (TPR) repeat protein